jgi:predicted ribosome quality control (RQC) complex YloA/Tae2 family protein
MNRRHVTFQLSSSITREKGEQSIHSRESRISSNYEVTTLNHCIEDHEETIFTLKCLSHRLRLTKEKKLKTLKEHVEELTKEIEYLRQELVYYKNIREVLMRLYKSINESHQAIKSALCEAFKGVAIFEQRLLKY